jgi:hypothetical protein
VTEKGQTEHEKPSTFESIFFPNGEDALAIRVPDYQRAFAWEVEQIDLFIGDLEEYESKTGYYFGHFIVEKECEGIWEVVDGQQRLTTFALFLTVCRVLVPAESHVAFDMLGKFSTVSYDVEAMKTIAGNPNGYFTAGERFDAKKPPTDEHIVKGLGLTEGTFTRSQRRMVLALLRFHQAFQKQLELEKITSYIRVVMKSLCSYHLTRDKSVAVSIFEMHNTRGIPLSTLEIIKAKLMKFVYDHGGAERDSKVEQIQREFGEIYGMEEQLATHSFRGKMTMEHLLRLHFRVVDDGIKRTEDEFCHPANNATANDLVAYLETMLHFTDRKKTSVKDRKSGVEYALNLAKEFKKSVLIVSKTLPEWDDEDQLVGDVLILEPDLSCQFFLIICRLMENSPDKADGRIGSESLSQWEKLLFTRDFHGAYHGLKRDKRDNFPGLFQKCFMQKSRIADVIQGYLVDGFRPDVTRGLQAIVLKNLTDNMPKILNEAFWWWWLPKLKYVLYKYEVRENAAIRDVMKGTISVEHILPQNWDWKWVEEEDVPPKTLSESERGPVREAVQKEVGSYINGLGNLMLLTRGENSEQSNEHPGKKRYGRAGGSYEEHDQNRNEWKSSKKWPELIRMRGEKIFKFMIETFVGGADSSWS